MKEIREWLKNGQPYADGLALYETHGKSRVILKSLQYGETDFTRTKLRSELEKILAAGVTVNDIENVRVKPVRAVDTSAERVREPPKRVHMPAEPSEQLTRQRGAWFAERHRLHAQLELLPTDEERRVASERILDLSDQLTASYQAAPELAEASLPRPDLSAVTDQGEIRRLLANLRPQASKLKKNPARTLDLQQVRADIAVLEKNLLKP